jgi:hypothetical protein
MYLVKWNKENPVVVNTLADAQEFLLSIAQEEAYEYFAMDIICCGKSLEEWQANVAEYRNRINHWREWEKKKPFSTLHGLLYTTVFDTCTIKQMEDILDI